MRNITLHLTEVSGKKLADDCIKPKLRRTINNNNNDNNNNNNNNNSNRVPKIVIVEVSEEDEHPKPTKNSIWHVEYKASGSQAQLLALSRRNCLELTEEGVKGEFLASSNDQCYGQVWFFGFGRQPH